MLVKKLQLKQGLTPKVPIPRLSMRGIRRRLGVILQRSPVLQGGGGSGFTMVELVMVIVIIGLLAAIIVPKYTAQREQAGIAATKANLESLRTAVSMFYGQEGYWPSANLTELVSGSGSGTQYIRAIPQCTTYDPTGPVVVPNNIVTSGIVATNVGGWYWNYASQDYVLHPNLTGQDANGDLFSGY